MTTKINLTIEEDTAEKIKNYAKKKGTSVSKLAETYFNALVEKDKKKEKTGIMRFAGMIKTPIGDLDKIKEEYFREKYGI